MSWGIPAPQLDQKEWNKRILVPCCAVNRLTPICVPYVWLGWSWGTPMTCLIWDRSGESTLRRWDVPGTSSGLYPQAACSFLSIQLLCPSLAISSCSRSVFLYPCLSFSPELLCPIFSSLSGHILLTSFHSSSKCLNIFFPIIRANTSMPNAARTPCSTFASQPSMSHPWMEIIAYLAVSFLKHCSSFLVTY